MLGRRATSQLWPFLACYILICITFAPSGYADEYFNKNCTKHEDCTNAHPGAKCLTSAPNVFKCGCQTINGFNKTGNICRKEVPLTSYCNNVFAFCSAEKSECRHAGELNNNKRCYCVQDYVAVKYQNKLQCAKTLRKQDHNNCTKCIDNFGTCYEFFDKSVRCLCPISRVGDDCEKLLVKVQCKRHELDICYSPHPDVNITIAHMYTHGYGTRPSCRARLTTGASNSKFCPKDNLRLTLALDEKKTSPCGVKKKVFDSNYNRFGTVIDVARYTKDTAPYMFRAFCEFEKQKAVQAQAAILPINGNENGERKEPVAKFYATNNIGETLKAGDSVRIGDKIGLHAMVAKDDIYSGMRISVCVASSSSVIPDPKATTRDLYKDGCPVPGQDFIRPGAYWKTVLGQINEWTTAELITVFKLPIGSSMFVHCRFVFCMGNDTAPCQPKTCAGQVTTVAPNVTMTAKPAVSNNGTTAAPATVTAASTNSTTNSTSNTTGKRRKKRAVAQVVPISGMTQGGRPEASMQFRLNIVDDKEPGSAPASGAAAVLGMSNAGFVGFMAGIVIILLLLIVVSALLLVRLRKGRGEETDKVTMTDRPQRFALPRNNHLRL